MSPQVDHSDPRGNEPADKWHPKYESISDWLDAEAPLDQCQKLRNRPKHRRTQSNAVKT
jgi:hypothetical protein